MLMGIEDKAALQKLLHEYAAAELRVRHAQSDRHDAMYAVVDWVNAYAERVKNAARVPSGTAPPIADVSGGN